MHWCVSPHTYAVHSLYNCICHSQNCIGTWRVDKCIVAVLCVHYLKKMTSINEVFFFWFMLYLYKL